MVAKLSSGAIDRDQEERPARETRQTNGHAASSR